MVGGRKFDPTINNNNINNYNNNINISIFDKNIYSFSFNKNIYFSDMIYANFNCFKK